MMTKKLMCRWCAFEQNIDQLHVVSVRDVRAGLRPVRVQHRPGGDRDRRLAEADLPCDRRPANLINVM